MSDFLLELRSEEIPARMQAGARASLEKLFREAMAAAGVTCGQVAVWSTPRRLALIARDLPASTEAGHEEIKGPRAGAPPQALEGFLRKTGLTRDRLVERKGVLFAVIERPGRLTRDVLAEAVPAICRAFPWPKSMRWGAASLSSTSPRWVRPLSGIVAILGEDLVECEVGGVRSGYATLGHRFHHPGEITIGGAHDYADKLRACHVIVDHAEREALIRDKARAAAAEAGLALVEDDGLVAENAGLTEWPVPLLGRFDAEFLEVPREVIQLTARTNQKYFVCNVSSPSSLGEGDHAKHGGGVAGRLANAFVCTANIEAADGGAGVIAGNRKVLAARLSDARFFWEQDRRKTLAQHAEGLARITFHEKLGTVADKAERVAKLARWLVEEGIVKSSPLRGEGDQAQHGGGVSPSVAQQTPPPSFGRSPSPSELGEDSAHLADLAEQAARLCKADLVTEMVGEFPELQGVIGGYYARAEGLPDEVADAIRDHYKPVGQGDEVPTAPVTVAVALADKLDTITAFLRHKIRPSGSKDPFALRRAAIAATGIILNSGLRVSLKRLLLISSIFVLWTDVEQAHEALRKIEGKIKDIEKRAEDLSQPIIDMIRPDYRYRPEELVVKEVFGNQESRRSYLISGGSVIAAEVMEFLIDRLKVQQREAGVRHDLIDAVFALGNEDDLVRLLARVHALQAFIGTTDGANLLAGYKRAANILKKENYTAVAPAQAGAHPTSPLTESVDGDDEAGTDPLDVDPQHVPRTGEEDPYALVDDPDLGPILAAKLRERRQPHPHYPPEPAEAALIAALDEAEPRAAAAVAAEDFSGAMAALATLRAPIDAFFDQVTVNDADPAKRLARLALLDRFRAAVHNVADFSRIEG
ncbi:MAG: glycine--tRNA ligase subunit beta [Novosphingobium sp.]